MMATSIAVTGLGAAADAQTAPISPVDALERRLAENRGVAMSEATTSWRLEEKNAEKPISRRKIRVEFGRGTVTATDSRDVAGSDDPQPPARFLKFKGRTYCQGWICPTPEGKTWVLFYEDEKTRLFLESGGIELGDPAALRAVLATTETRRPGGVYDGTRTTVHQGTITYAELYRTSPAFRDGYGGKPPAGRDAKVEVSWRLWTGEDQLVRRIRTSRTEWLFGDADIRLHRVVDTRLTGWDAVTDIPVPSADETAGRDDWKDEWKDSRAKRPVS
ncbi:hypothetical protein [Planomonospora parontospora]|uniref:hypothetical protein n=2 Tax=Planomonospora parontospora TaxID=58119 RepID=UPI001940CF94|nr:hypothetical protein [Planomonospora parontospora]